MINKIMNLEEGTEMYNEIMNDMNKATDNDLVIVARSFKNRKDDRVKPIDIKNGIYFYLAYDLDGKTAYIGNFSPEQIYKAKSNMIRRARLGSMMSLFSSGGSTIYEYESKEPMNVATLDKRMYGAGLLICEEFLREMKKKIGDYYILPSSIHEIIFAPVDILSLEDATEMVIEVNSECVSDDEYLADRAFTMKEWI